MYRFSAFLVLGFVLQLSSARAALTSAECSNVIREIARTGLSQTRNSQLGQILDAISFECGVSKVPASVTGPMAAYEFSDSDLFITWDGQSVQVGERARATYDYTLPKSVRIQTLSVADVDPKKKNVLIQQLKQSIATMNADVQTRLQNIYENGDTNLIISGYAVHDPNTYTQDKLDQLNAKAYGLGVEKVIRVNEHGNKESLFAMAFFDSHNQIEPSVGYEWQTPYHVTKDVAAWLGFSAGLTSRSDILHRMPIPYVLPTVGLSVGKVQLKGVFIPKLNGGINHGNVLYIFASVPFEKH